MKHLAIQPVLGRLLESEEAFEWNVLVPHNPAHYGGQTILSMVKLAGRRGRVRWFIVDDDEVDCMARKSPRRCPRDLTMSDFITDLLDDKVEYAIDYQGDLILSFESKTDARAFSRDLASLIVTPKARKQLRRSGRKYRPRAMPAKEEPAQPMQPLSPEIEAIFRKAADDLLKFADRRNRLNG